MTGRVGGKIAIVTGGASGLGAETARYLAREGAAVVLTDRDSSRGQAVADELAAEGFATLFLQHDVTDEAGWVRVVEASLDKFGRIDVLVNSAGILVPGALFETALATWRLVMAVNLDGIFLGMRAVGPAMQKSGGGSIINLSSVNGKVGVAGGTAYCASKGGVLMLTKAAAIELAPMGIRVNSVHPGVIDTPMVANSFGQSNEMRALIMARHPLGRFGAPREIALGIVFLASDEASFMTGSELVIDGGYTAI